MIKKIIGVGIAASVLLIAVSIFAQTPPLSTGSLRAKNTSSAAVLACVSAAVDARETSLNAGITTHGQALNTAYTTRAAALHSAYAAGTNDQVKSAIKVAWTAFRSSIMDVNKAWVTSKSSAWTQFRTAVKACKASTTISDGNNSSMEAVGN